MTGIRLAAVPLAAALCMMLAACGGAGGGGGDGAGGGGNGGDENMGPKRAEGPPDVEGTWVGGYEGEGTIMIYFQ